MVVYVVKGTISVKLSDIDMSEVLETNDVNGVVVKEIESIKVLKADINFWGSTTIKLVNVKFGVVVDVIKSTISVELSNVNVSKILETNV